MSKENHLLDPVRAPGTAFDAFRQSCDRWPAHPFLATVGADVEWSFATVAGQVQRWTQRLSAAGYGMGHRVAVLLGSEPEHFVVHLALNALGIGMVPLNPDMTPGELAFVLAHSEAALVIHNAAWRPLLQAALRDLPDAPALLEPGGATCASPRMPPQPGAPGADTEASLLYTSGTTGRPKGCVLSNAYYLRIGHAYADCGGVAQLRPAQERILNPLPVFHQNAGIFSFMCAVIGGHCLLMVDRFHASTWWRDVAATRASVVHYLGVMPAILLKLPIAPVERRHAVRLGIGAGVEPSLHRPFEERFGFPLVELWGMTEVGCGFIAAYEPRQVGTRAVGGPRRDADDLMVRLVDDDGRDAAPGAIGELLVRRAGTEPARGLFSGYLKDPDATAAAWRGGWFHTGDAFWQDAEGCLHFAERKKNIIRRAGENIAAAEVEAVLLEHPGVARVAVIAVPDELRDEEVMACVVALDAPGPANGTGDAALADELAAWCRERLTYFKVPGWFMFLETLPVTTTQKVQKARIFEPGIDPRRLPGALDLRVHKKRGGVLGRKHLE